MAKKYWKTFGHILLLSMAVLLLCVVCIKNSQASQTFWKSYTFQGEYSQNGGEWLPLEADTPLSALKGDLILRGHFDRDIPEGEPVIFYRDHIEYRICVNGSEAARFSGWGEDLSVLSCARDWDGFTSPGIGTKDVVEIHLRNSHRFGNAAAYTEFLQSLYPCSVVEMRAELELKTFPAWGLGFLVIVLALGIMGVALAFSIMHIDMSHRLWPLGLMSFFTGGYIALDTASLSFWGYLNVFTTYTRQLCIMLAVLELGAFITVYLSSKARKAALITVYVEGLLLAVMIILCLAGKVLIYDTLLPWTIAQFCFCPVLLVCCAYEWRQTAEKNHMMLLMCITLLAAVMLDMANLPRLWWPDGLIMKVTFVSAFFLQLVIGLKNLPEYYQKASRIDELEKNLKDSHIVLALSQIKMHFVFNLLNAISGMCKYDPQKADEAIVRFARYLRKNVETPREEQMVSFDSALLHLEDYIALEKIRFGDRIQFVKDIAVRDFEIPSLVLQTIVENSIRHGFRPKASGGTIILRTWMEGETVLVSIQDDGVGFDPHELNKTNSIGLENVRFRLQNLICGALDVQSTPGSGTTVTISIPCEEVKK